MMFVGKALLQAGRKAGLCVCVWSSDCSTSPSCIPLCDAAGVGEPGTKSQKIVHFGVTTGLLGRIVRDDSRLRATTCFRKDSANDDQPR